MGYNSPRTMHLKKVPTLPSDMSGRTSVQAPSHFLRSAPRAKPITQIGHCSPQPHHNATRLASCNRCWNSGRCGQIRIRNMLECSVQHLLEMLLEWAIWSETLSHSRRTVCGALQIDCKSTVRPCATKRPLEQKTSRKLTGVRLT